MTAQRVERIVRDLIGKRCRIHITASSKLRIFPAHEPDKRFEEVHAHLVIAHHRIKDRIRAEGAQYLVFEQIRSIGFLYKIIASDMGSVFKDAVKQVSKKAFKFLFFRKNRLKYREQAMFF